MKLWSLTKRNIKEMVRDPLTVGFGLGFPLVLIFLLSAIQSNVPVELFKIDTLAPGAAVFGLSFITLFSALIVAGDRNSALLQRLYTAPLKATDFILGYTLPMLPIALMQGIICYLAAIILGLKISINLLYALLLILPISLLYIALGLLFGSCLNYKQVGGICGALLVNLAAWFSGIWFDVELVGGVFSKIANALPFIHAVNLERAVIAGNYAQILPNLIWVLSYALVLMAIAILLFLRQMKKQ